MKEGSPPQPISFFINIPAAGFEILRAAAAEQPSFLKPAEDLKHKDL